MLVKVPRPAVLRAPRPSVRRRPFLGARRYESSKHSKPTPWRSDTVDLPSVLVEETSSQHTLFTLDFFRRFIKFSAIGVLAVSVTTWSALMGAHMWVEHVELAPESDEEVRKWEWDLEAERWSGGAAGGTDPGLGFMGRMGVRSAWIAQNWGTGTGTGTSVLGSKAYRGRPQSSDGASNAIEARLEYAQDFLNIAINSALKNSSSGRLRPATVTELIARHASIMERMGSRDALFEARAEFERVWAGFPGKGLDAARVALKLGDLNKRLGDAEDALAWWARTIQLVQGDGTLASIPPVVPESPPSSPLAQRTLVSTLVSLSAHYATSGQLSQARAVEESSLGLLRSIKQPDSFESATPPQALHALYVLHRSSLLSIHLAEVMYALKEKPTTSIQWLSRAAESSERVALALTGLPLVHPDAPESQIPHPPSSETPLIPDYAKSRTMARPAKSLLRDARRTAAEAWNLTGILIEGTGAKGSADKALECYERALGWAGVATDRVGGIGKAGEGILEAEWQALWANYVRARDTSLKQKGNS